VTFAVVEYLSHRFVRGGGDTTMDSSHGLCGPTSDPKQPVALAGADGGEA